MFILGGYIFDKRLRYSSTVWTSAGAASIIVAGTIGWQFNKASRSREATPAFRAADRSSTRSRFLRPPTEAWRTTSSAPASHRESGRTASLSKGLSYLAFVGNGLNTLNISATKIDTEPHVLRQRLVGTAGGLRRARQVTQHVRRLFRLQNKYAFGLARRLPGRGRTVSQTSINRAPRTRPCTTPTAC